MLIANSHLKAIFTSFHSNMPLKKRWTDKKKYANCLLFQSIDDILLILSFNPVKISCCLCAIIGLCGKVNTELFILLVADSFSPWGRKKIAFFFSCQIIIQLALVTVNMEICQEKKVSSTTVET